MIKLKHKSSIVIFVLICTFVFSAFSLFVANVISLNIMNEDPTGQVSAWSGSGTSSDPYKITKISDLTTLSNNIANGNSYFNKHFQLTTDLDFSSVANFVPIGATVSGSKITKVNSFGGVFDGDGHVIKNLKTTINDVNSSIVLTGKNIIPIGFFACLGYMSHNDSSFEQWYVDYNQLISQPGHSSGSKYYHAIARVKNLKISGFTVSASNSSKEVSVGGIAGVARTIAFKKALKDDNSCHEFYNIGAKIDQCVVDGLTINAGSGLSYLSGFVGSQVVLGESDHSDMLTVYGGQINRRGDKSRVVSILNCMATNIKFAKYGSNSQTAVISPAYSLWVKNVGTNGVVVAGQTPEFVFYYDIRYCVTDNTTNNTIAGTSNHIDYQKDYCKINNSPGYTGGEVYTSCYNKDSANKGFYNRDDDLSSLTCYNEYALKIFNDGTSYHKSGGVEDGKDEYGNKVWTISVRWAYLTKFLIQITYESSDSAKGKVTDGSQYPTGYTWIPKGEQPLIKDDELSFFHLFDNYILMLQAIPYEGYEFVSWTLEANRFVANFGNPVLLTFKPNDNTNNSPDFEGSDLVYKIEKGSKILIEFKDAFGYLNQFYKTCVITVKDAAGNSIGVEVTYEVDGKYYEIRNCKINGAEKTALKIESEITTDTTFEINAGIRNHNITFD